jgi:hypothetical protein
MQADSVTQNVRNEMFREWQEGSSETNHEETSPSYNELSEKLLTECLNLLEGEQSGFEAMIEVGVYYPSEELLNDERKIVGWRFTKVKKMTGGTVLPNPRKRNWLNSSTD